jgi:hypothetical protein
VWDEELAYILDDGIENFGGDVICGHIANDCYGITAGSFDFVDHAPAPSFRRGWV